CEAASAGLLARIRTTVRAQPRENVGALAVSWSRYRAIPVRIAARAGSRLWTGVRGAGCTRSAERPANRATMIAVGHDRASARGWITAGAGERRAIGLRASLVNVEHAGRRTVSQKSKGT